MSVLLRGNTGIVPALDADTEEQLVQVVKATARLEGVAGYKIGLSSALRHGLRESVRRIRDLTDLPLLYDHQKAGPDMPDMARKYADLCAEACIDGAILFPTSGPTSVDRFVGEMHRVSLIPIVGGEIPATDYRQSNGGYIVDDALDRILARAAAAKADHFVLPANNADNVSRWSRWIGANVPNAVVFLTGFGALGGTIEDSFAAADACARRFAIVGRLIVQSKAPDEAVKRLYDAIRSTVSA